MRQRVCRVTLWDARFPNVQKVYENLAVSFEVNVSAAGVFSKGVVRICGLSTDTIEEFTMFQPNWTNKEYFKRLKLEVGHMEDGKNNVSCIIDGYIERAVPTAPPDRWLVCSVVEALNSFTEYKEIHDTDTTLYGLVQKIGKEYNVLTGGGFTVRDYTGKALTTKIKEYRFFGNMSAQLSNIMNLYKKKGGFRVWYQLGQFYIADYEYQKGKDLNVLIGEDDKRKGLIIYGIPQPYNWGCNIRTEIVDTISLLNKVTIKSKSIPSMNGVYNPFSLTYVGESRGTNWYVDMAATRIK